MSSFARLTIACITIAALVGCSTYDAVRVARIATSKDPAALARSMVQDKAVRYVVDPASLERDLKRFGRLLDALREAVGRTWGGDEVREPTPKEYVKYTQNYQSRAMVDFDKGIITVETIDQRVPKASLKNAIVTTLLTPDDPRAVDMFSDRTVELGETPFLYTEVKDHEGKDIRSDWRAGRFADYLIRSVKTRQVTLDGQERAVLFVTIPMVQDHANIRARKYSELVNRMADRYGVSRNLVYAIIKTESDFNPFAVSRAPAFGLMQIVPTSAGRDVHQFLNGRDGVPSRDFLFMAENNIEYGTVYLHLLQDKYLKGIEPEVTLEYCTIAAYNGGAGSVLRTFDPDQTKAFERINGLAPLEVYRTLRRDLPYEETRRYLAKVLEAKKDFVNF